MGPTQDGGSADEVLFLGTKTGRMSRGLGLAQNKDVQEHPIPLPHCVGPFIET